MPTTKPENFTAAYLTSWIEPDTHKRADCIAELWSREGTLSISSNGATLQGIDQINEHITRVHDDLIAGKNLIFTYDQELVSGKLLLLRWSMTAPNGEVVGRGADTVTFTSDSRIESVHMFMGLN